MTALLRLKVDDKLYRPITHYRDTILQLADYFDRHRRVLPSVLGPTGAALPGLYAGRVFAELGDAPQALDYYQRALDAQPTGQGGSRRLLKQRGLLHSMIGTQMVYQDLYDFALDEFKVAQQLSLTISDTLDIIFNYRDIGEVFYHIGKPDSALAYYHVAMDLSRQSQNEDMLKDVQSQIARVLNSQGKYGESLPYITAATNHIDSASISAIYSIAARTYQGLGKSDSALYCYQKLLQYGNVYGKSQAYRELFLHSLADSDLPSAYDFFLRYKTFEDSLRKIDRSETVARMQSLYNYHLREQETQRLRIVNLRQERLIGIITLLSAMVVIVAFLLFLRRRQAWKSRYDYLNQLREEAALGAENTISELQSQILKLQNQIEPLKLASSKKYEFEIRRLESEKAELQNQLDNNMFRREAKQEATELLECSDQVRRMHQFATTTPHTLDRNDWDAFFQAVNTCFPNFPNHLAKLGQLSDIQKKVCYLRKAKFQTREISRLLFRQETSVYSVYSRLYQSYTGKKGSTEKFDELLSIL